MDKEIQEIFDSADAMQKKLDKLEARQTFSTERIMAIKAAANSLRDYRGWVLSELRVAFDPEYSEQMEKMTKAAKK